jgi:hypothetical protein
MVSLLSYPLTLTLATEVDEGEIVVLLHVADPAFHLGGNPRADLVGWEVSGLAEQQLQAVLTELRCRGCVPRGRRR